jgi:hypothetical protein
MILGAANDSGTAQTTLQNAGLGASFTLKTTNGSTGATGIFGWASSAGPYATRGVYGRTDSPAGFGVQGKNDAASNGTGAAVQALGGQNHGVDTSTDQASASAIHATHSAANGVVALFENTSGASDFDAGSGVRALTHGGTVADIHPSDLWWDAAGEFAGPNGVIGASTQGSNGVLGLASGLGFGVHGRATEGTGVYGYASSAGAQGVVGRSDSTAGGAGVYGHAFGASGSTYGVYGFANSADGYALYAAGRVGVLTYIHMTEIADPAAPPSNSGRLFARDNGAGKTQLCVRFPTGAVQVLATEP